MGGYIIRRLISLCFTLLAVSVIVFFLMSRALETPFSLGERGYSEAAMQNMLHKYGLDIPVYIRYLNYITGVLRLDFGNSYAVAGNPPVIDLIARTWPVTLHIGLYTLG